MAPRKLLGPLLESVRVDGAAWRRLAQLGSMHAPEWFKRGSPPLVAALLFALVTGRRRGATANLERVLGVDRRTARGAALRMYAEFAFCTSEAMEQDAPRPPPLRIDRPQRDAVEIALAEGNGVIIVTAHLGSWDIAAKTLLDLGAPVNLVMARETNATTRDLARARPARPGLRTVFADTSVFSSIGLIGALRRNEVVAIQLDRPAGAGGVRMLPFLGAPAPFPSGPFVLARLAHAPIIPVFVPRLGRRHYAVEQSPRIDVPGAARDPAVLDRVMAAAVAQLENVVRRHPTQWFQFAPFWREPEARRDRERSPAQSAVR